MAVFGQQKVFYRNTCRSAAIVGCSNAQFTSQKQVVDKTEDILEQMGLKVKKSPFLFADDSPFSGTAQERADALMDFYRDETITDIFDVSGGDLANEILPYLDFDVIARSKAVFWGYSDLTTLINAIYAKTGRASVLYQIRNLAVYDRIEEVKGLLGTDADHRKRMNIEYHMVQGEELRGIVVGGNLRCFLKLAGTPFWPDMKGKVLLLESLGGGIPQMVTYLNQYKQMGVFEQVQGILLGTFTQMEREGSKPDIVELVRRYAGEKIPLAKTAQIGHGKDAKAIIIGEEV